MLEVEAAVVRLVVIVIIPYVCRIMLRLKCVIGFDRQGALQATLKQGPFSELNFDGFNLFFFNRHRTAAVL